METKEFEQNIRHNNKVFEHNEKVFNGELNEPLKKLSKKRKTLF